MFAFADRGLATLAVALAVATNAQAQSDATTIDAQRIEGVSDLEMSARGSAEIHQGEMTIFGDFLRYNREFGELEGHGGVRLQSGPDRFFGPDVIYNTLDDTGVFEKPGFLLQRERPARGSAERIEFLGRNRFRLFNARFTTCQPGQDDWFLESQELTLDYDADEGKAKQPRLRFFDHTMFAFPYASFPLESRRRSGFLAPYYSQTNTRGLEIGVPYYWNIAPEQDLTVTPVYMARRGYQVKNLYRYLSPSYTGEARFEYLPNDPIFGATRTGTAWFHTQQIARGTTAQVDYARVSDDQYFVDLASQVKQVSQRILPADFYVTNGTALPRGGSFSGQARVQKFQTLQDPLAPIIPPYARLPQLNGAVTYNDVAGHIDTSVPAEFVKFSHPTLVEGARSSISPSFAIPRLSPGYYLTPKGGFRYMGYALENPVSGEPANPSVMVPWVSLDSGLVFERNTSWFGRAAQQTLEPRLFYVYVPYRNQDHIPLFDTSLADFNYATLFTENRFVGGDRFGDANQLTAAVTTRFLQEDGQERLRATIGQRFYFRDERVALSPGGPLRTSSESDLLASIGTRTKTTVFDFTTQYNPYRSTTEKYGVSFRYAPEIAKVINASYRFQTATLRQIDISGQWPIRGGWYGVGRYNYSILDDRLVEGLAGAEYNAGCWVFRFVMQKLQASAQVTSTALVFQIEFTGVGQVGTAEAVQLLRRDVPGYSVLNRTDPALAPPTSRSRLPFEQVF
jgi:LPS-assembly protein